MFLGFLALITSFCISAIAIYFSVTGWGALFAAAAVPAMLMFGSIEIGKLVAAAFLHWHWKDMGPRLKYLITSMVLVAMFITSIGIYGFLAKGHLDQEIPADSAVLKIERIEERIFKEDENIGRLSDRLEQLDEIIQVYIDREYVTRGLKARKEQKEERELIDNGIKDSYNVIDKLEEQRLTHNEKIGSIQAKLGPIKYITQILNVENKDAAVQIVIVMAMFTFDPFAIALLLAAMWGFKHATIGKQTKKRIFSEFMHQRNGLRDAHSVPKVHTIKEAEKTEDNEKEKNVGSNKPAVAPSKLAPKEKGKGKDAGRHGDLGWRKK